MLDERRFALADRLLDQLLEVPRSERAQRLRELCDDPEVCDHVERLLDLADSSDDLLAPGGALEGPLAEELAEDMGEEVRLQPGTQIGGYAIHSMLGEGGMGEVYRARDRLLGRDVAIKGLPEDLATDPDRRARLQREARLLASVNHPHIAAIYGIESFEGREYLVLELVEGVTLKERLARGGLRLGKAVEIALQIVEALEEAHRKGIVHRDLKPDNIKLGRGDVVKVLDFGVAKSTGEVATSVPARTMTMDTSATQTGLILGTAAYMSPEQARGLPVDKRTDIWAFGCVLFEMLTGAKAFDGPTPSDILAAVLRAEVDLRELPPETPQVLVRLIRRCIQSDLKERLQDIGDARLELNDWLNGLSDDGYLTTPQSTSRRIASLVMPWLVAATAAVVAILSGFASTREPPAGAPGRHQFVLEAPGEGAPAWDYSTVAVISPGGQEVVYAVEGEGRRPLGLWRRPLSAVGSEKIAGTDGGWQPFFEPSGDRVGFFANRKLLATDLQGNEPTELLEIGGNPRGASWSTTGEIVVSPSQDSSLVIFPALGGRDPEPLTELDVAAGERSHRWPHFLPDGRGVLFANQFEGRSFDSAQIAWVSVQTRERRVLVEGGSHPRYSSTGHLLFVREGRLFAIDFDPRTAQTSGEERVVLPGVRYDPRNGGAQFDVASEGSLVYWPSSPHNGESFPVSINEQGESSRLLLDSRRYSQPQLAPDDSRLLLRIEGGLDTGLWSLELDSGSLDKIYAGESTDALFSHDGQNVVFAAPNPTTFNLWQQGVGRRLSALALTQSAQRQLPCSFSPDGRTLWFQQRNADTGWDIYRLPIEPGADGLVAGVAQPALASRDNEMRAAVSSDGRWIAYESDELDDVVEIYVASLPDFAVKRRVSFVGARRPVWGPRGGELYFWQTGNHQLMAVTVAEGGAGASFDQPREVLVSGRDLWRTDWRGGATSQPGLAGYDVLQQAGTFVLLQPDLPPGYQESDQIVVAVGGLEALADASQ